MSKQPYTVLTQQVSNYIGEANALTQSVRVTMTKSGSSWIEFAQGQYSIDMTVEQWEKMKTLIDDGVLTLKEMTR